MCVLVVSNYFGTVDETRLAGLSAQIGLLIERARGERRAIAFLQRKDGEGLSGLGLRIGRYEPIFAIQGGSDELPMALTDFIAHNATNTIDLAGIASMQQFHRLQGMFERSGYFTNIRADAALLFSDISDCPYPEDAYPNQLSGNEPLNCGELNGFASMKNHSTRCPRA